MTSRKERIEVFALVAEIVGAVAVVISVAYLAVQVSEGNKELRSQSHYNALSLGQRPFEIELENAELARIISIGYVRPGELSAEEWYRFTQYQVMAFNAWEYYFYEHGKDAIPEQLWIGANAYYVENVATKPGLWKFWSEYEHIYAEPFHSYVDRLVREAAEAQ
ncbi:MAG: hypothetical protein WBM45_07780 [Woeseiaceae bacterium]